MKLQANSMRDGGPIIVWVIQGRFHEEKCIRVDRSKRERNVNTDNKVTEKREIINNNNGGLSHAFGVNLCQLLSFVKGKHKKKLSVAERVGCGKEERHLPQFGARAS